MIVFMAGLIIGFFSAVGWVSSYLLPGLVQGPERPPVIGPTSWFQSAALKKDGWHFSNKRQERKLEGNGPIDQHARLRDFDEVRQQ